jgi:serine phosphatase RsbU (regulator of sigma subunit)
MISFRHATRALATEGHSPAGILHVLNNLGITQGNLATCAIVLIDLDTDTAQAANAGHPPLIVRSEDDPAARILEIPRGPILGAFPDSAYGDHALQLQAATLLLLYTDGLIERRTEPLDEGLERLRDALSALNVSTPPTIASEHIQRACLPAGQTHDDDACIICLAYDPRQREPDSHG